MFGSKKRLLKKVKVILKNPSAWRWKANRKKVMKYFSKIKHPSDADDDLKELVKSYDPKEEKDEWIKASGYFSFRTKDALKELNMLDPQTKKKVKMFNDIVANKTKGLNTQKRIYRLEKGFIMAICDLVNGMKARWKLALAVPIFTTLISLLPYKTVDNKIEIAEALAQQPAKKEYKMPATQLAQYQQVSGGLHFSQENPKNIVTQHLNPYFKEVSPNNYQKEIKSAENVVMFFYSTDKDYKTFDGGTNENAVLASERLAKVFKEVAPNFEKDVKFLMVGIDNYPELWYTSNNGRRQHKKLRLDYCVTN